MKKIIMIDQDGVVCNKAYQVTRDISRTALAASHQCLLVPNSDTPTPRLRQNFHSMIGINPQTIIGELGAVLDMPSGTELLAGISPESLFGYKEILASNFALNGFKVEVGDSATWVREKKTFTPNSAYLLLDSYRCQSVGFYVLATDSNGQCFIDPTMCVAGLELANSIELPAGLTPLDLNPKYGIAIANALGSSKSRGYKRLRELYPEAQFFMIGDQNFDIIDDERVIHCSVANGADQLKTQAAFIASQETTAGLEECLLWIMNY